MRNVARLKMGYYPLPEAEGVKMRALLSFAGPASVIDPCVGQGTALQLVTSEAPVRRYGVELDAERARIPACQGNQSETLFLRAHCLHSFTVQNPKENSMKPSKLYEALHVLIGERVPLHIWGACGIGKSQIVSQVASDLDYDFLDVRAVQLDPVDLRGLPRISADLTEWVPPKFLPTAGKGILFLDELTAAPQMTQAGCYQLVLDRKLGEYVLPDGWVVIAAGNPASERGVHFAIGQILAELMAMKRTHEEEPQCGHVVLDASRAELKLREQIGLVGAQMIRTELVRRLVEVLCEPLDETQITPRRAGRVVATLELFEHHFAKTSHSVLPPVTHTLSRPQNYSSANTVAAAAPAASF